ncbi:MAG: phosphatidate cytidylyltransferase [Hyphomonadaceae bacterium]|nr:phosphatidate cytidylyltransferase [Clostridia bacterium]
MLKVRLISAAVALLVMFAVLFSPTTDIFPIFASIFASFAIVELYTAVGVAKHWSFLLMGIFTAVAISYLPYLLKLTHENTQIAMLMLFVYLLLLFVIYLLRFKTITFGEIAIVFLSAVYISFFLAHILFTRLLPNGNIIILFIFAGAFMTDTFAYFSGMLLGKHKLCPSISPNKTVEGAIGGLLGVTVFFVILGSCVHVFGAYTINYINLTILGLLCGVTAQIGDLSASLIKRQYNIKDFGNIMPGHGGVLDRFDSLLFVAPTVYYFVLFFNILK